MKAEEGMTCAAQVTKHTDNLFTPLQRLSDYISSKLRVEPSTHSVGTPLITLGVHSGLTKLSSQQIVSSIALNKL